MKIAKKKRGRPVDVILRALIHKCLRDYPKAPATLIAKVLGCSPTTVSRVNDLYA
jgi:hypothetical protein